MHKKELEACINLPLKSKKLLQACFPMCCRALTGFISETVGDGTPGPWAFVSEGSNLTKHKHYFKDSNNIQLKISRDMNISLYQIGNVNGVSSMLKF